MIFDAGTGIRAFGSQLVGEAPVDLDLFFTHTHFDHVAGLPFFVPAFDPRNRLRLWAGHLSPPQTIQSVLCDMMIAPLFPVPLSAFYNSCTFNDFECGAVLQPRPDITIRDRPAQPPERLLRLSGGVRRAGAGDRDRYRASGRRP